MWSRAFAALVLLLLLCAGYPGEASGALRPPVSSPIDSATSATPMDTAVVTGTATAQSGPMRPSLNRGWSDDTLRAVINATIPMTFPEPRLDWPWIAWYQDETPDNISDLAGGIYAHNLETNELIQVASSAGVSWPFGIDDGVVIWIESGALHVRNLISGMTFSTTVHEVWNPVISGRWVVWTEWTPEHGSTLHVWDIWEVSGPVELVHPRPDIWLGQVDVSGDLITWIEAPSNSASRRLVVHDITTGTTLRSIDRDWLIGPFDIEGTTLVYVIPQPWPSDEPDTIVIEDLESGATRELLARVHTHEGGFTITTDGRFVIFMSNGTLGYDLELGRWFKLPPIRHAVDLEHGLLSWAIARTDGSGLTELHLARADEFSSGQRSRYFPETDTWLAIDFLTYWNANGGVPVLGFPLDDFGAMFHRTQLTERQRLEWHPENAGTPYEMLLDRLGDELLLRQGRDWSTFPTADPTAPHYFSETRHAIDTRFYGYWSSHGLDLGDPGISYRESVGLFGYPLSEPMTETNADGDTVLTQYFERAVFEYHSDNPLEWQVLLRRLGAELLVTRSDEAQP
jgi:hypothetical protein